MLRISLSFLLILAFNSFLVAQDIDEELKNELESYFKTLQAKDVDKTLDYMYPKMFEIAPREMLKSSMETMYEDSEMEIGFSNSEFTSMEKILYKGEESFATVDYSFEMTMKIFSLVQDKTTEEEEIAMQEESFDEFAMIHSMYNEQFGIENVQADKENGSFVIKKNSKMLAVKGPEHGWKFLEVKLEMMPMMQNILPKEIIEALSN